MNNTPQLLSGRDHDADNKRLTDLTERFARRETVYAVCRLLRTHGHRDAADLVIDRLPRFLESEDA